MDCKEYYLEKQKRDKKNQEIFEKIADDRLEYGYDSVCLRVDQLTSELAQLKATHPLTTEHKHDYDYWKRFYGNRSIRIYQIIDDLMYGKGHSSLERCRGKGWKEEWF